MAYADVDAKSLPFVVVVAPVAVPNLDFKRHPKTAVNRLPIDIYMRGKRAR
jgi:hypothetical protein